jgi:hypothetical protein
MLTEGPTVKPGNPSPCGCEVKPETEGGKLRLWFCRTHAAAFQMLETLQFSLRALDIVVKHLPSSLPENDVARQARTVVEAAIQKAMDNYDQRVK